MNSLTLEEESSINGALIGTSLQDGFITAGSGDDTLILRGGAFIGSNIDLGDGNNSILLEDEADISTDIINLGSGNDTVTTSPDSDLVGSLFLGAGNDTVNLQPFSFFGSTIDLGEGDDNINLSGLNFFGEILGGDGTDTLSLEIAENVRFTFDFDATDPFVSGIEVFDQNGLGLVAFTGEDQDFVADYNLNGGALLVDAVLPQVDFISQAGTRFGGIGDVGNVIINGAFAPGSIPDGTDLDTLTFDTVLADIGTFTTNNLTLTQTLSLIHI